MSGVDPSLRGKIRDQILADYGEHTILPGNKMPRPRRLPTGSLALDYVSGGGIPFAHMTRFWGPFCLGPDTKVLKVDYSWDEVSNLVVGDELVGFDEYAKPGRGNQREFRRAVVQENFVRELPARRIVTDRGSDTIVSSDHLWLVQNQHNGAVKWMMSGEIKPGDKILHFAQPWGDVEDREAAAYLAGLFDGEGWFAERARLFFAQNPGPVLDNGIALLKQLGFQAVVRNQTSGVVGCRKVCATGTNSEMMKFLHQIPSIRMRINAGDWWVGRTISPKGPSRGLGDAHATVLANEDVGRREVFAIQTSTQTLIADGLMSHNSSGKTTALYKLFAAAQHYGELRHGQLTALSELSIMAGELKQAKLLKEQAKREREFGTLSCAYVCAEKAIDTKLLADLGIDLKNLELVMNTRIEVIGDIVQKMLGGYHVIGVDSTTATISLDELGHKDGILGELPMLRARRWGYNMDWWRDRLSAENCIVYTSHSRSKTGVKTGFNQQAPEHPPGGYALNHEPGLILRFMKGGALKRKSNGALEAVDQDSARGSATASAFAKFQPAGGELIVRCEKNKVGAQGRVVLLHHDKRTGDFDSPWEYEKFASYFRVLEKNGSWWVMPGGQKTQQVRSVLEGDADLRARVEATVLRCAEDPSYEAALLFGQTEQLVALPSAESV